MISQFLSRGKVTNKSPSSPVSGRIARPALRGQPGPVVEDTGRGDIGTSKLDIYRAAGVLVREHGGEAPARVAARMVELAGDTEGRAVWERIGRAVDVLLAEGPGGHGQVQ